MKRIQSACLQQTIHFELKEDIGRDEAAALVQQELAGYKAALERKRIRYRIDGEDVQPDGSIILRVCKQYNSYDCGSYLQ